MLNKWIIILLSVLVIIFGILSVTFYYQKSQFKIVHDTLIIKQGYAVIDSNKIQYVAKVKNIVPRTKIGNFNVNEVSLDNALNRSKYLNYSVDTSILEMPEIYTAVHDTVITNILRIKTIIDDDLLPLSDTNFIVNTHIRQSYFHPEGIFSLDITEKFDTLNVKLYNREKIYEKQIKWYETSTFHYTKDVILVFLSLYFGIQIGVK